MCLNQVCFDIAIFVICIHFKRAIETYPNLLIQGESLFNPRKSILKRAMCALSRVCVRVKCLSNLISFVIRFKLIHLFMRCIRIITITSDLLLFRLTHPINKHHFRQKLRFFFSINGYHNVFCRFKFIPKRFHSEFIKAKTNHFHSIGF